MKRRDFIHNGSLITAGLTAFPFALSRCAQPEPWFRISLAQWSLHRALQGGMLDNFEFPVKAKRDFGIQAVEYVSTFFDRHEVNPKYLDELKRITDYHGITNVLIMVDGEGSLGASDKNERTEAVENHYKWVDAARHIGCHAIRVNASGDGGWDALGKNVSSGLHLLAAYAQKQNIKILVENHGGLSSSGAWLSQVMKTVNLPGVGTLPDFGNFTVSPTEQYDKYQGMTELMPFAAGVSAKSYAFDDDGNETSIDFDRMMKIVKKSGYRGYIGIEYEGDQYTEEEGIMLTKRLLERYL